MQAAVLPLVLSALLAAGCQGCRTPAPAAGAVPARAYLLDGFEGDGLWTIDSADNYGLVDYTERHVTEGKRAMRLTFFDNGRHKSLFRREVRYDLSGAGHMYLDVYNHSPGAGVACAMAFRSRQGLFFETRPLPVAPGTHSNLCFRLDAAGLREGTDLASWQAQREDIRRVMLLVFPGDNPQGRLTVDRLRADSPGVDRTGRPVMLAADPLPDVARQHRPFELSVRFRTDSLADTNGARRAALPIRVRASLVHPDGSDTDAYGFLKDRDQAPDGSATYALRLNLPEAGLWRVAWGYYVDRRWFPLAEQPVHCIAQPAARGMIRVDAENPRYFSFGNGDIFFPLGQNVCWAADYEPYFRAMRDYGGNMVRIWLCPWNHPLVAADDFTRISLGSAAAVDRILALAERHGLFVQLVFAYHGWLDADWGRNPFNAANGGPCELPQDFWVDRAAARAFKGYLTYAVDRWSALPAVFAWELMNEADLTPRYRDDDIVAWHRRMSDHLAAVDPYDHPVTTSVSGRPHLDELWRLPGIDFTASHLYRPDLTQALNRDAAAHRVFHKPHLVQEIGRGWLAREDQTDPRGVFLQHALWLSGLTSAAGVALPWWWDTHIEAHNLYPLFAAVAAFHAGEDPRGRAAVPLVHAFHPPAGPSVHVQGLLSRTACLGFVYSPDAFLDPAAAAPDPILPEGHRLALDGLVDGGYDLEWWSPGSGAIIARQVLFCRGGRLVLSLPDVRRNLAFKLKRRTERPLRATLLAPDDPGPAPSAAPPRRTMQPDG